MILVYLPNYSYALTGTVISVADGDTITILDSSNKQHKILEGKALERGGILCLSL
jgi:hypothetical protein